MAPNRNRFWTALAAVALAFIATACRSSRSESEPPAAALAQATFHVANMTCASCNVTVKTAAERVTGVREARADFREKRAVVTYEPARTTPAAIASAISEAGYEATPLTDPRAGAAPH